MTMMCSTSKMKLNYRKLSDGMQFVTKTRQDNDVTDNIDLVYAENGIELP